MFSVPVPGRGTLGKAYAYGGWYAPKQAVQFVMQFIWAELIFLENFYFTYSSDLREHGLLLRPVTMERPDAAHAAENFDWNEYFRNWRESLLKLHEDHNSNTPDDTPEIALTLSEYSPEEKELWRRGWEEMAAQAKPATKEQP